MQAARLPCGSLERLLKVTAFTISIYSCVYRPFVPFRSPAGETSEAVAPDRGIRAIAEKVRQSIHALMSLALSSVDGAFRSSKQTAAAPRASTPEFVDVAGPFAMDGYYISLSG